MNKNLINNEGKTITVDKATFEKVKQLYYEPDVWETFVQDIDGRMNAIILSDQEYFLTHQDQTNDTN